MTQAAKQYREQIAVALLAVAVVYIGCALGLLFKSYDLVSVGFAEKAALDGYLFSHPVLIGSLAVAVLLVAVWGEPSTHARTIVLAVVGIGAVALVFAVITWIAAFSADGGPFPSFVGIQGAGTVVGAFIVLAQITLLVLVLFFAGIALQALPRPVPVPAHWGAYPPGWGPAQGWQQPGEWPGQPYPPQPGQPAHYAGQPAAPWTAAPHPGQWGQQPPGWQPSPQQTGWGSPAPSDAGWQQSPPGWPAQPEPGPEGAEAPETPASNADLYWRATSESGGEDAAQPSHLAADDISAHAEADVAEAGEHRDPDAAIDDPPTTVSPTGSWSQDAGPSASDLASSAARGDSEDPHDGDDTDGEGQQPDDNPDGTDTSGWWRPSSTS